MQGAAGGGFLAPNDLFNGLLGHTPHRCGAAGPRWIPPAHRHAQRGSAA